MSRILVIEDEKALSDMLGKKLITSGFDVELAENGAEGLEKALELHPDLILLDIVMPVMDGLTMLAKLRADTWGKAVPVIILTNLSDTDKIRDATEGGVSEYLIKSNYSLSDLVSMVNKKLGK